jgi:putative toxin-antitoxin system antitoxin component (TIGR02293 family)
MSEREFTYGAHLSDLLTGRPGSVREPAQWHQRILEGLPFAAADGVKSRAGLTDAEMARLLGMGEATLRRARAAGGLLDPATSDRLYRLSNVIAIAMDVLGSEHDAISWLRRAQPGLDNELPLERLLTQAGADEVATLLRRIDHGVYT